MGNQRFLRRYHLTQSKEASIFNSFRVSQSSINYFIKKGEWIMDENKNVIRGKQITYKVTQVADLLGETPPTIRYWCNHLKGYISNIETTEGGHRVFKEENIRELQEVQKLIQERDYTIENVREYLDTPEGIERILTQQPAKPENLTLIINRLIEPILSKQQQELKLILETIQKTSIEDKRKMEEEHHDEILELIKKTEQEHIKETDELKEMLKTLNAEISTLQKTVSSNQKNGFFNFLRKK